jgi:hypothetical protein
MNFYVNQRPGRALLAYLLGFFSANSLSAND